MKFSISLTMAFLALATALPMAHGAFIVEPDNDGSPVGKANDHFAATPATGFSLTATAGTAVGLTGNQTAFGNPANSTGPDRYTLRYTPGTDSDNTTLAAAASLGNSSATDADGVGATAPVYANVPQLATGLAGGVSGLYNVYFTTLDSANVSATGSIITINSDLPAVVLNPVNMNSGNTGPDEVAGSPYTGGANNRWLKIATVPLTAGNTYTVVIEANTASFVSQRTAGVMWELVEPIVVPEPSTFVLLSLSCVGLVSAAAARLIHLFCEREINAAAEQLPRLFFARSITRTPFSDWRDASGWLMPAGKKPSIRPADAARRAK